MPRNDLAFNFASTYSWECEYAYIHAENLKGKKIKIIFYFYYYVHFHTHLHLQQRDILWHFRLLSYDERHHHFSTFIFCYSKRASRNHTIHKMYINNIRLSDKNVICITSLQTRVLEGETRIPFFIDTIIKDCHVHCKFDFLSLFLSPSVDLTAPSANFHKAQKHKAARIRAYGLYLHHIWFNKGKNVTIRITRSRSQRKATGRANHDENLFPRSRHSSVFFSLGKAQKDSCSLNKLGFDVECQKPNGILIRTPIH